MTIKLKLYIIFSISFFLLLNGLKSQERVTTFGLQIKPIIPSSLFNTGEQLLDQNNVFFSVKPKLGYSFGMVIRKGLTKALSLETGINYLKRGYTLTIDDQDLNFTDQSSFSLVNYEIPISLLVYVKLGRNMFMNVSGGVSMDIYPSDLFTYSENFQNDVIVRNWIQTSLIANVGWEYRTEKSGYFYLGGSYHRPFSAIAKEIVWYNGNGRDERPIFDLIGNYVTIDFRYFFHEDPEKKKRKTKNSIKTGKTK
tara:strand:+ start:2206 stop:2964 length:759 start_codon:yes stop_codon:yes gene_type:complete